MKRELLPAEREQVKRHMYPLALASGLAVLLSFFGFVAIVAGFIGACISAGTLRPGLTSWPAWCWWLVAGGFALNVLGLVGARAGNGSLRRMIDNVRS